MIDKKFWINKRVLITGHTGFKGSWLLLLLKELQADIYGYSLPPTSKRSLYSEIVKNIGNNSHTNFSGNIENLEYLHQIINKVQPEIVIHLAAQALVRKSYQDNIGTWNTNLIGSLNILESLKNLNHTCSVVMITTDKVYENREWIHGYRETDTLGGHDPYSASKAAAEIAIASWRKSFCGCEAKQNHYLKIATARSGNVIGGGDWAEDRIIPDIIRALKKNEPIKVRNPQATRPWQHVLDPLNGYLLLAQKLMQGEEQFCEPYNFGPTINSNRNVENLINDVLQRWPGKYVNHENTENFHEAKSLHLQIDKAHHLLEWRPRWNYQTTIDRTVEWYQKHHKGAKALECCLSDIQYFNKQNKAGIN